MVFSVGVEDWRMTRSNPILAFVLVSALLPQLGCANWRDWAPDMTRCTPPAKPLAQAPVELPPEQAAQVCLAAAREMEKNGQPPEAIVQHEKARENDPRLKQAQMTLAWLETPNSENADHARLLESGENPHSSTVQEHTDSKLPIGSAPGS